MQENPYHLDSSSNQITSHIDGSLLSDARDSRNGLTFNARIPLGLNDVDSVRHSQIQATWGFKFSKTSESMECVDLPNGANSRGH